MTTEISGRSILVVDDEPLFARTLADGLGAELSGIDIHVAHHGQDALEILSQRTIDLVITDVNMPIMDGMTLVAEMVSRRLDIPVIMATAFGNRDIELDARRHGVVSVIDKPIDFPLLVEICAGTLRARSRGAIEGITLAGFLQLLEMERRSCTVRVFERGDLGLIIVRDGQVVSSSVRDLTGFDALCEIITWVSPRIEMAPYVEQEVVGEPVPLHVALLEGARRVDEAQRGRKRERSGPLLVASGSPVARHPRDRASSGLHPVARSASDSSGPHPAARAPALGASGPHPVAADRPLRGSSGPIVAPIVPPPPKTSSSARTSSAPIQPRDEGRRTRRMKMADIEQAISAGMDIQGAIAVALVDYQSGMCLGFKKNSDFPIEIAAAGNTEVVRAKMNVMKDIGIDGRIHDILITLDTQYHLILPLQKGTLFLYMAIDRDKGNLALARHRLAQIENDLSV